MSERRVLLATSADLPELGEDERLVLPPLASQGISASAAVWTDPAVDWSDALVVIRSTWDYTLRRGDFLRWADEVATVAVLWNPAAVIHVNTDKRYLTRLGAAGIPVVPTAWIDRGTTPDIAGLIRERGWPVAVVKPAVSAGAHDTIRVTADSLVPAQQLAERVAVDHDVMVQPYVDSVDSYGERSLIFIGGDLSHAVRKAPMLAGALSPDDVEEARPAADELALARRALDWVGVDLLYARVDIARVDDVPVIMEIELTEPRLYLRYAGAAERFATAIAAAARS